MTISKDELVQEITKLRELIIKKHKMSLTEHFHAKTGLVKSYCTGYCIACEEILYHLCKLPGLIEKDVKKK